MTTPGNNGMDDIRRQVEERIAAEKGPETEAGVPGGDGTSEITSDFIQSCLRANELGDGTLYAAEFRDQFLYCKNYNEWYEWAGHYWQRDVMNHSLAAVEKIVEHYLAEYKSVTRQVIEEASAGDPNVDILKSLKSLQSALLKRVSQLRADKRRTACLKFAHTIQNPIAITGEEFDQRPMLFPCANGVIDLETGLLKPGRPLDYLSMASPVQFLGIDTPAQVWERSLLEIFNGNEALVAYLQRLFGYCLTGLVTEKVFPILYGPTGWNGRSLIVETVSHCMGKLAAPIPAEMLLSQKFGKSASGPSPDIMSLKGIRLAFASEIDEGQRFSAAKIKWITGRDEMVGRNPNDKYFTHFQPTHKTMVMSNTKPGVPAHDTAFWERTHLIEFTISFVNRDPRESHERRAILDLDRQILHEESGVLAWLVRGCLLWQKEGLNPPKEVTQATAQYRRDEDLVQDFIEECLIKEPGAKEPAAALYSRFVDWYHDNVGKKEPSGTWFGKQLSYKFPKNKVAGCVTYHGVMLSGE
jgi:putative DNA primase/helicase